MVSQRGKPSVPVGEPDLQKATSEGSEVRVWRLPPENEASAHDGAKDEAQEALLYIKIEHKQAGDRSNMTRNRQQFMQELKKLHQGLSKKYCTKRVDKVHQKIGRLKQKYPPVAKHYTLEVREDEQGVNVTAVT